MPIALEAFVRYWNIQLTNNYFLEILRKLSNGKKQDMNESSETDGRIPMPDINREFI